MASPFSVRTVFAGEVHFLNSCLPEANVPRTPKPRPRPRPKRICDVRGVQKSGRHLIQERREQVVIVRVKQQHIDRASVEFVGAGQPAEPASDDDDFRPLHARRIIGHWSVLLRRRSSTVAPGATALSPDCVLGLPPRVCTCGGSAGLPGDPGPRGRTVGRGGGPQALEGSGRPWRRGLVSSTPGSG